MPCYRPGTDPARAELLTAMNPGQPDSVLPCIRHLSARLPFCRTCLHVLTWVGALALVLDGLAGALRVTEVAVRHVALGAHGVHHGRAHAAGVGLCGGGGACESCREHKLCEHKHWEAFQADSGAHVPYRAIVCNPLGVRAARCSPGPRVASAGVSCHEVASCGAAKYCLYLGERQSSCQAEMQSRGSVPSEWCSGHAGHAQGTSSCIGQSYSQGTEWSKLADCAALVSQQSVTRVAGVFGSLSETASAAATSLSPHRHA